MNEDVKINCQDCGRPFVFSVKDQKFYEEQGYVPPKRCRFCRTARKTRRERINIELGRRFNNGK